MRLYQEHSRNIFFLVKTAKQCFDLNPPADRERAALWSHCDIPASVPSETGRKCFLLSCCYRILEASGSTREVLNSCRTLRIPRVNLYVNICVGSH